MNPMTLLKLKNAWSTFTSNHPKFPAFLQAARNNMIMEGSVIEITIKSPDGREIGTNVRVTQSDMELFDELKNLK